MIKPWMKQKGHPAKLFMIHFGLGLTIIVNFGATVQCQFIKISYALTKQKNLF